MGWAPGMPQAMGWAPAMPQAMGWAPGMPQAMGMAPLAWATAQVGLVSAMAKASAEVRGRAAAPVA